MSYIIHMLSSISHFHLHLTFDDSLEILQIRLECRRFCRLGLADDLMRSILNVESLLDMPETGTHHFSHIMGGWVRLGFGVLIINMIMILID